jgi:hypothetical protein
MPKGPDGQKRPGDVIGAAIMVAKIATGEIEEETADGDHRRMGGYGNRHHRERAGQTRWPVTAM